jgi:hypothetical protein
LGLYTEKQGAGNSTSISLMPVSSSSFDPAVIDKTLAKLDELISSNGTGSGSGLFDLKSSKYSALGQGIHVMREDAMIHMYECESNQNTMSRFKS